MALTDEAQRYRQAVDLFVAKQFADAVPLFAQLAQADPDNQDVRMYLARSYYHSAQLGRAEESLREIIERWPTDAYAHLVLARTLQRAGRAEEGRQYLLIAEAMGLAD